MTNSDVSEARLGGPRIPALVWRDGAHLVEPTDGELRSRLSAGG